MADLKDKVVIITGATGNVGEAATRACFAAGAKLALVDRKADRLAQTFPDIAALPDHLFVTGIDVTNTDDVPRAVNQVIERYGRIDALVNTAGGYFGGKPLHETPLDKLDFLFNLNVRSVFLFCQVVIPTMIAQGSGRIINFSAQGGLKGGANNAAYAASKAAVLRFTESMDAELRARGINVNCILPGTIDTPQNREAMPRADFSMWVTPEAIANVIVYLASDEAAAVRGAAIPV